MSKAKTYSYLFVFILFCGAVGAAYYFYSQTNKLSADLVKAKAQAVKTQGAACLAIPLQNDNLGVKVWASIAAMRMLSMHADDIGMKNYASLTQSFFMGGFWPKWKNTVKTNYFNALVGTQQAFINGVPVLKSSGFDKTANTYAWIVTVPYKFAKGKSGKEFENGTVTLEILKVQSPQGFKGLAINGVCLNNTSCNLKIST